MSSWKEVMIEIIRKRQYYKDGVLEAMTESEISEIYECLMDWIF